MLIWFFLTAVCALWLLFGSLQDLRQKEVANWLTLSLIGIGLFSRLFFSIESHDWSFFLNGAACTLFISAVSFSLYYCKVFAGGDTKLLIGLGPFIPGSTIEDTLFNCLLSVLILLILGAIYSLIFSFKIAIGNKKKFKEELGKRKKMYYFIVPAIILLLLVLIRSHDVLAYFLGATIGSALVLYPYFLAVDKCMIKAYSPTKLTPGDWLQEDVKVNGRVIKSTVHGLTEREIAVLIKARKKVLIKEGIPFVPVFFLTYLLMVFFFASEGNLMAKAFSLFLSS